MSSILFIIKYDFKRIITVKNMVLLVIPLIGILGIKLDRFEFVKTQLNSVIFPLIIIIISSQILSREFECGTYKYLFTGCLSRGSVILCKILSLCAISIVLSVVASCVYFALIFQNEDTLSVSLIINEILNSTIVFISFTMFISSIGFFISIISRKFISTFLILYLCFYDIFRLMIETGLREANIDIINRLLNAIPVFNILDGFKILYYPARTVYIMMIISILVFCIDLFVLNRRDL